MLGLKVDYIVTTLLSIGVTFSVAIGRVLVLTTPVAVARRTRTTRGRCLGDVLDCAQAQFVRIVLEDDAQRGEEFASCAVRINVHFLGDAERLAGSETCQ